MAWFRWFMSRKNQSIADKFIRHPSTCPYCGSSDFSPFGSAQYVDYWRRSYVARCNTCEGLLEYVTGIISIFGYIRPTPEIIKKILKVRGEI